MKVDEIFGRKKAKWFEKIGLLDEWDLKGFSDFDCADDVVPYMKKMFIDSLESHIADLDFDDFIEAVLRVRLLCFKDGQIRKELIDE